MVRTSTAPPGRRQRRREQRTTELLEAAMEIVVEDGADGLTIARLAHEADAAVGAVYRYFDSKAALLVALQERALQAFDEALAADLAAAAAVPGDPRAHALRQVVVAFRAWPRFARTHPTHHALVDASLSDPRELLHDDEARRVDTVLQPVLARCAATLEQAEHVGALRRGDAALRTLALWAAVHGAGHFRKRDRLLPADRHAVTVETALIDTLLRGWGASPADVAAALS